MKKPLQKMFREVPHRYDLINRLVTLGQDRRWRRCAVDECLSGNPSRVLDLCTGTGDVAIMLAKAASSRTRIVAGDFSSEMLDVARKKAVRAGCADRIDFELVHADDLPYAAGAFDAVTLSFGIRNLTYENPNRDRHLAEIRRILRDGGKLVTVESSQPPSRFVRIFFKGYVKAFTGPSGKLISGKRGAYEYLTNSVADFYGAEELTQMLLEVGFGRCEFKRLLFGAAAVHTAIV